ncbi:MAG TPA: DNA topoisomerase IB, partial [Caulobacteraceae bacterium]
DAATLARIGSLVIPPAWNQVWISPSPRGHIQAVGRDARGRKQYLYHPLWRAHRDEAKYGRLHAFGRALPKLRAKVRADLRRHGLPREKVLAAVVELLELTLIRVGNDAYARANKSFGLTTLRKRHAALSAAGAVFEFRGKSGVVHRTGFHDRRLARVLRGCQALPGQRLFQYLDEAGERHALESHDVNAYLHAVIGDGFSAKDMRTWAGTLAAARTLAGEAAPQSETQAKRAVVDCVKAVAGELGNTAAVCRACYIHPVVIDAYAAGRLTPDLRQAGRAGELALIRLLEKS